MGVITGRQIKKLVNSGELIIDPFDETLVAPATYDLRLHHKVLVSPVGEKQSGHVIDLREKPDGYEVLPGQMIGILSYERVGLPLNISGRFGIRSSLARKGMNAFGGIQLDPGFRGKLIMNLINVGPEPIPIQFKETVFSVEFSKLEEMAETAYSGPYQDQDDFPADQYEYILSARTTSLAEIPSLRLGLGRLTGLLEELEDRLPDPDLGMPLKQEIENRLIISTKRSRDELLTPRELKDKLGC